MRLSGVVVVGVGWGAGGGEVDCGVGSFGSRGGDEVGEDRASLVDEEGAFGFGFKGVLKGDLKGWDRVSEAAFRRRRFEGWMGDMIDGGGREIVWI